MRPFAPAALLSVGCASIYTPEQIAQHRRELSAPKIGCPEVDVSVPPDYTREEHSWIATCRGERFLCRAEVVGVGGFAPSVQTTCERAK